MKDEKEQVEIFEEEEILAFTDEEGNEVKLCQIACVEHEGEFYTLLENYDENEEDDDDGIYIYKILNYETEDEDEPLDLEPVETEELADVIFGKFLKVYNDQYGCDCCEGDCDHEHCDCDHDHCDCKHDDEE